MQSRQGTLPRTRSAFTAAFLSLLFPGLGHAYGGAWERALAFAAAPLLLLSLGAGLALSLRLELLGFLVQPAVLALILVADVVAFGYRAVAAIDAWRVALHLNALEASGGGRLGRPRLRPVAASVVGLLAVLAVMAGGHAAVAYYDLQAYDLVSCVFDATGRASCDDATGGTGTATGADPSASASGEALPTASIGPSAAPSATLPPWNGSDQVNILLVGADRRPGEPTFNTDTLIVVSIDPATRQVGMFQVPRDTVDVPLPKGPAQAVFGRVYRGKINSLWTQAVARPDLFPGSEATRGPNALKAALGALYGLEIRWYVEVDFDGFRRIIDTVGGVTINVQMPVSDDRYPASSGRLTRVYIPAGIGRFTGEEALTYARSRHSSSDFDRGSRQQRVLVSLREQTDFGTVIARLPALVDALKRTVRTDIPVGELPGLVSLASRVDSANIRSFVFAPPYFQEEVVSGDPRGYVIVPNVERIRAAVAAAFELDPAAGADRERIAAEDAEVWILNGSGIDGQAAAIAGYLDARGVKALAPSQTPSDPPGTTTLVVYNGAEGRLPETIALLEAVLGVTATVATDPEVAVDIIVTTAKTTPELTPPPGP